MQIIHVDMDMFYAAVEIRDNPELAGKPLIIGSLPHERGVVATCSYEARKFGVRSAMNIKDAYHLCPHGIYMHPNGSKYSQVSKDIHKIWDDYTDICEYISLDEGFLDITGTSHLFAPKKGSLQDGARAIAHEIKNRTEKDLGLTCSVGIGYSMMSAKLASEEKKPNGFFEILTASDLKNLIINRNVRIIYGVGVKTAEALNKLGIKTVGDIYNNESMVAHLLGNQGRQIIDLAHGIDNRKVTSYTEPKSLGTEHTFQHDIKDFSYLEDVLLLVAQKLCFEIKTKNIYAKTITLKVTYADMKTITRSKTGDLTDNSFTVYKTAADLLANIEKRPIRLIGITLSGFAETRGSQMTLFDTGEGSKTQEKLDDAVMKLKLKFGAGIVKTARELKAEKRVLKDING